MNIRLIDKKEFKFQDLFNEDLFLMEVIRGNKVNASIYTTSITKIPLKNLIERMTNDNAFIIEIKED